MSSITGFSFGTLTAFAAALLVGGASAADFAAPEVVEPVAVPSMFDVAFGAAGVTDYRFRGVSASDKDPAIQGYAELQVANWVYVGAWASSVSFPARYGLTDPSLEIDIYGGVRRSWNALTIDVGGLYYYYPGETTSPHRDRPIDYWEIYAKPTVMIGESGSISGNIFWSSDFINVGSNALFLSVIPKYNFAISSVPGLGFFVSGELGKQWLGKTTVFATRIDWKDYVTWNIGGGVTYKAMTLDVRYSDTDLSRAECAFNTGVRSWCGSTVVAKISFDTSLSSLK